MPRYNNDGRTAKFIHTSGGGGGRGGGFQGGGKKYNNDFKFTSQQHRGIKKKNRGPKVFQRLDDDGDLIMSGEPQPSSSGQGGNYGGRRKQGRGRNRSFRPNQRNSDFSFGPSWHKVTILDGTTYNREIVLSTLASSCRVPFTPIAYTILGTNTVFFVEERGMAEALAECSGKINVGDNQVLKLKIIPSGFPQTSNFDVQCETKVRAELDRRFNTQLQTLTLSNFLMSPELIREYFLPLNRASVVVKLLSLLEPLLSNLVGLDLSNNKLVNLEGFGSLPKKAPSLKALNLSKNKFKDMYFLDKVHGLPIVELYLEENPVCNNYNDQEKYIRSFQILQFYLYIIALSIVSFASFFVSNVFPIFLFENFVINHNYSGSIR